jgi:hypothetical protein
MKSRGTPTRRRGTTLKHRLILMFALFMTVALSGCLLEDEDPGAPDSLLSRDQALASPERLEDGDLIDSEGSEIVEHTNGGGCFRVRNYTRMWCNPCSSRICRIRIKERNSGSDY